MWGDMGRCREVSGGIGRYREISGDVGRSGGVGEVSGDVGRYGLHELREPEHTEEVEEEQARAQPLRLEVGQQRGA